MTCASHCKHQKCPTPYLCGDFAADADWDAMLYTQNGGATIEHGKPESFSFRRALLSACRGLRSFFTARSPRRE